LFSHLGILEIFRKNFFIFHLNKYIKLFQIQKMATDAVLSSICTNSRIDGTEHGQIIAAVCNAEGSLGSKICGAEGRLSSQVCNSTDTIKGQVHNTEGRLQQDIYQVGLDSLKATCDAKGSIKDAVNTGDQFIQQQLCHLKSDLTECCKDTQLEQLKATMNIKDSQNSSFADVRKDLCETNNKILLTSKDNLLELLKAKCELERQASDNKQFLERQLATCCCELKERIADQAAQTRALIQANESARIRDLLQTTQNELLLLRIGGGGIPLAARGGQS
jgi:hypothetical protein